MASLFLMLLAALLSSIHIAAALITSSRRPPPQRARIVYTSTTDDIIDKSCTNEQVVVTPIQLLSSNEYNRIDEMVTNRSQARWDGNYQRADEIRCTIDNIRMKIPLSRIIQTIQISDAFIPQQEEIDIEYKVLVTDIPRSDGGGSSWDLEPIHNPLLEDIDGKEDNVLQLAHAALGMAVSASEQGVDIDKTIMDSLIGRAENRLQTLKQRRFLSTFLPGAASSVGELHGRKSADALLWFALAGVRSDDGTLFDDLVDISTAELERFGMNTSCRGKDVLHIIERVAMAGVIGYSTERLYHVAADCLEYKMESTSTANEEDDGGLDYRRIIQSLRDNSFGLHSNRPLLGLWRFSTRQRKQREFFYNAARHFDSSFNVPTPSTDVGRSNLYDWSAMFDNPTRPLVVDVGCGFGVSLLGLAKDNVNCPSSEIKTTECNFLGVDLSRIAIGYAQGVCDRLNIDGLKFVVDSAEECLNIISKSYPGEVSCIMIQFPTPYKFSGGNAEEDSDVSVAKGGFNSQLPESPSDNFMVSKNLLCQIHNMLSKHNGQILIQSNCEDVAVHMRNSAIKVGFQPTSASKNPVTALNAVTQRAQMWVETGGERAIGQDWSAQQLLPSNGKTETEVACLLDNKPVHRCLLKA